MNANMPKLPKFEFTPLKYGYSNARVRGMKGLILKAAFLDELIKVKSVDAMVELLQRTHYKDELLALSLSSRGSELIETASGRHFLKVAAKVRKFCPKDDLPAVEALLRKWDILNLQYILNARKVGKSYDEIKNHVVAVGGISAEQYERIGKADDDKIADEVKRTPFGRQLFSYFKPLSSLKGKNSLASLQSVLDTYGYAMVEKSLSMPGKDMEMLRKLLKLEADSKNIMIIERLKHRGVDKDRIKSSLVPGGALSSRSMADIAAAKDMGAALRQIKSKLSGFLIKDESSLALTDLEIALEKHLAKKKLALFGRRTLSIGVILGFLLLKEEEVNNIRKIATAKEYGISEQETREMLVIV